MKKKIENLVKQCKVCKEEKYDNTTNPVLEQTPIPEYPGQIIHIDIYSTEKKLVLTAIDKFSKLAQAKIIKSKAIEDIRNPLREIIFYYGVPKYVVMDNEKSVNSHSITFMLKDQLNIDIFQEPPHKSTVNGQVERFHSTLSEIMRCIKKDGTHRNFPELLERAVYEYNYTIHSVTKKRPLEVFFGRTVSTNPEANKQTRLDNIDRLIDKQKKDLEYHNQKRNALKNYNVGEEIYVKINTRLGSKLSARYKKEIVKINNNTTVVTESGKKIHKSNIRNN